MAARASGEAAGALGVRSGAGPVPDPDLPAALGSPRPAPGSEAGRGGERGSQGASVHRLPLTGTVSAAATVAGRVSSPALPWQRREPGSDS